jgi:hypothetical protein
VFEQYPKQRSPLPREYQDIFNKHYLENREGASTASFLGRWLESWMHKKVAADLKSRTGDSPTLELGAGTLNHVPYEPSIRAYDIVEPFEFFYENSPNRLRIRNIFHDISEIPETQRYRRIISIATLEHLLDLPLTIARAALVLEENGVLRIGIPNEGTILWWLGWNLTTGLEFRLRHKLDYKTIMENEHVNTAREIEEALSYFFRQVKLNVLGIHKNIAFYRFYACSDPDKNRCEDFLQRRFEA